MEYVDICCFILLAMMQLFTICLFLYSLVRFDRSIYRIEDIERRLHGDFSNNS